MIKNILVPTSGSPTDEPVFAVAHALAGPSGAHLHFCHVRLSLMEAAVRTPHLDFCMGQALPAALAGVRQDEEALAQGALSHFKRFCSEYGISVCDAPGPVQSCTASWLEERDHPAARLMMHARHSDLIVLGRPRHVDYMPKMLLDDLLMGCGRPLVFAPERFKKDSINTVAIGWKETPEAARALTAAMPLLEKVNKVVLLHIAEKGSSATPRSLEHLARELKWHAIEAETHVISDTVHDATFQLSKAAIDLDADLLVVGAFGHARLRELIFGGVTESLLEQANLPVFMLH